VLLAGTFASSIDFGSGPIAFQGGYDGFVAKLDPAGAPIWSRGFGDWDFQQSADLTVDDADNVLVTGAFEGAVDFGGGPLVSAGFWDIFVAKLDPGGGHLWSSRYGDAGAQMGYGIAADSAGNVLLTGDVQGTVDFGGGTLTATGTDSDGFIAKLTPP
jgi:hypothetical protein